VAKTQQEQENRAIKRKECMDKHNEAEKMKIKMEAAKAHVKKGQDEKIEKFMLRVMNSKDLSDELQNLVDNL
jgi:hypothetical protein